MQEKYDVIVIGGGPAGSSAAKTLSEAQIRVLIIDKEEFPRDKLCGGSLTPNSLRALKKVFPNINYISNKSNELNILKNEGNNFKPFAKYIWKKPIIHVVDRFNFDHCLLKEAIHSGAKFEKNKIEKIKQNKKNEFELISKNKVYLADFLIVACGVFGTSLFKDKELINPNYSIVYQTSSNNISKGNSLSFFKNGYFWKFDAGNYSKIVLGKYPPSIDNETAKKILSSYSPEETIASTLPVFNLKYTNEINRSIPGCLFIGDSGGFANNWTGEGIPYAIDSGDFAARAILKYYDNPEKLNQNFLERLFKMAQHLQLSESFRKVFYKDLNESLEMLREKSFSKLLLSFISNYHSRMLNLKFRSFLVSGLKINQY